MTNLEEIPPCTWDNFFSQSVSCDRSSSFKQKEIPSPSLLTCQILFCLAAHLPGHPPELAAVGGGAENLPARYPA